LPSNNEFKWKIGTNEIIKFTEKSIDTMSNNVELGYGKITFTAPNKSLPQQFLIDDLKDIDGTRIVYMNDSSILFPWASGVGGCNLWHSVPKSNNHAWYVDGLHVMNVSSNELNMINTRVQINKYLSFNNTCNVPEKGIPGNAKIILYPPASSNNYGKSIGVENDFMWFSVDQYDHYKFFYNGNSVLKIKGYDTVNDIMNQKPGSIVFGYSNFGEESLNNEGTKVRLSGNVSCGMNSNYMWNYSSASNNFYFTWKIGNYNILSLFDKFYTTSNNTSNLNYWNIDCNSNYGIQTDFFNGMRNNRVVVTGNQCNVKTDTLANFITQDILCSDIYVKDTAAVNAKQIYVTNYQVDGTHKKGIKIYYDNSSKKFIINSENDIIADFAQFKTSQIINLTTNNIISSNYSIASRMIIDSNCNISYCSNINFSGDLKGGFVHYNTKFDIDQFFKSKDNVNRFKFINNGGTYHYGSNIIQFYINNSPIVDIKSTSLNTSNITLSNELNTKHIQFSGNITGTLTDTTKFKSNVWFNSSDGNNRFYFSNGSSTKIRAPDSIILAIGTNEKCIITTDKVESVNFNATNAYKMSGIVVIDTNKNLCNVLNIFASGKCDIDKLLIKGTEVITNTRALSNISSISCDGTINVTGIATFKSNVQIDGHTTLTGVLTANSNVTIAKTLDVTGVTTLSSNLIVKQAATLSNTLNVLGATTISGKLIANSNVELKSTLLVTGAMTLNNSATISGEVTISSNLSYQNMVPIGSIVAYAGSSNIPSMWLLCNGQSFVQANFPELFTTLGRNVVPDLTNKFILGGSTWKSTTTGGSSNVQLSVNNLPSHSHALQNFQTGTAGDHSHSYIDTRTTFTKLGNGDKGHFEEGLVDYDWNYSISSASGSTGNAGGHTHSISGTIAATGGGQAFSIMPPYYILTYIIKAK